MIQQPTIQFESVAELLFLAVLLTGLAIVVVSLIRAGWAGCARRMRCRRSLLSPGEATFVARLGPDGPELFVVGEGVRRLTPWHGLRPDAGEGGFDLAARVLGETIGRPPSTELTWAFVEEHLGGLGTDGFVLPAADVAAWLDAREPAGSRLGRRAAEAAGACAAFLASHLRPATRATGGQRVTGGGSSL